MRMDIFWQQGPFSPWMRSQACISGAQLSDPTKTLSCLNQKLRRPEILPLRFDAEHNSLPYSMASFAAPNVLLILNFIIKIVCWAFLSRVTVIQANICTSHVEVAIQVHQHGNPQTNSPRRMVQFHRWLVCGISVIIYLLPTRQAARQQSTWSGHLAIAGDLLPSSSVPFGQNTRLDSLFPCLHFPLMVGYSFI